jgi:hypothetical protein
MCSRREFLVGFSAVPSLMSIAACRRAPVAPSDDRPLFTFDFATSSDGWSAGFADYPVGWEPQMDLVSGHRPLPSPLDQTRGGLFIAGSNSSDDLFMFWKHRIGGLRPNRTYAVDFTVQFATNVPKGIGGIGGSPDSSVFVKVGGAPVEPIAVSGDSQGRLEYRLNIDKGNQAMGGKDAVVIGTAGNLSGTSTWELKDLQTGPGGLAITTSGDGSVWVLVGTDSGFEGRTSLYYTRMTAQFTLR